MRPRTLFVDQSGVLGGAELYLMDIVCRLQSTGHVLLFEEGPFLERLKEEAIPAVVLGASRSVTGIERDGGWLQDLKSIPGILSLVRALSRKVSEYDVVFANSQKAFIVSALAAKWARRPLIWNLHDILTADHFSRGHRKIAVTFANLFADRVIVNSEATRASFVECGGDESKTHVVYNGIDAQSFQATDDEAARRLRYELGAGEKTVVGLFSRLTSWKGQHVLIEAAALNPDVHVWLVGGALFQDDAAYEGELRSMARALGVEDRVRFVGFRNDVPLVMKACDIIAHCSTAPEPFGRVIVEGMLASRPVIASKAGGAMEIVTDGETGLLVNPGDAGALSVAIRRLIDSPDEAQRISDRGYRSARERFSIDSIVKELETEIRKVVGELHGNAHPETSITSG